MSDAIQHWQTVQTMLRGYRAAHILITCTQLEIFKQLAEAAQSADSLAEKSDSHPAALRRLLDAAVACDLLRKTDGLYRNAPVARTCLAEEGPYHLGHLIRREGAFYQRWSYLTEAVRSGQRPEANIRDESQNNWVYDFEMALFDLARTAGPVIAEMLPLAKEQPLKLLDVGGGHGGYSMAIARHYTNVEAVVYELPAAAEVARQIIERAGMSDRVSVQEGDFQTEALGSGYDVALLFGVLVSETAEGKLALLKKAYEALTPGGLLVIRGFWLDESRTAPPESTIFSLHMLLSTEAGDISTLAEAQQLLRAAGFADPYRMPLPDWLGSSLLLACKPE